MTQKPDDPAPGMFHCSLAWPAGGVAVGYVKGRTTLYTVKAATNESAAVSERGPVEQRR